MIAVYCFSGSGHSRAVADAVGDFLKLPVRSLASVQNDTSDTSFAVAVFPVYCQRIPEPVRSFLKTLRARYVVPIVTYGRISHGNVLVQAAQVLSGTVVAAAYVPTGHTYLSEEAGFDRAALQPLLIFLRSAQDGTLGHTVGACMLSPSPKSVWADLLPSLRSRIGVRLRRNNRCTNCGRCTEFCTVGAMQNGFPSRKCIRCLRCVSVCRAGALTFSLHPLLARYLKKYRMVDPKIELFLPPAEKGEGLNDKKEVRP